MYRLSKQCINNTYRVQFMEQYTSLVLADHLSQGRRQGWGAEGAAAPPHQKKERRKRRRGRDESFILATSAIQLNSVVSAYLLGRTYTLKVN